MTKKILYIANFVTKGNSSFYKSSIHAAHELGCDFHIASNFKYLTEEEKQEYGNKNNVKLHQIDFVRNPIHLANLKAYRQLIKLMRKEQIDIVHCNTPVGGVYGRLAAKKCHIKGIIYQAHGFHFFKGSNPLNWLIFYPIEKLLSYITDLLITINKEDYELACTRFSAKHTAYVNGVGFDDEVITSRLKDRDRLRKELGFTDEDVVLLSVGEINANKNHITILKAIKTLNNSNVKYFIAGTGNRENLLKEYSAKNGLEEQVKLLGFRKDIASLLSSADIFCFPSKREGLSVALMEAMSAYLPCVVSDIRGNRDLIDSEQGGYLVAPLDSAAFAEKIKLLVSDKQLRKRMGIYNFQRISNFSHSRINIEMRKIYSRILDGRK